MDKNNNSLLYSIMLSMNSIKEHKITEEDVKYANDSEVSKCQIIMYKYVIECICQGMSYEELKKQIDNFTLEDYQNLSEEKRNYLQRKLKKDLNLRENNLNKKGEI